MKQYVDKTSFSGLNFEYGRYFSRGSYSLGVMFGWNIFSEQFYGTTNFNTQVGNGTISGAITGNQLKYINAFPMLITATYYFKPSEHTVIPFIGLGTGAYYVTQRYQAGIWEIENDTWHFGISPEAGVTFKLENRFGLNTSARLNYAFDSGESITGKEENDFSYWSINVGLTYVY